MSICLPPEKLMKLVLCELTNKLNTKPTDHGVIFGTPSDQTDLATVWILKRSNFLLAANLLGILPHVLGTAQWHSEVFNEAATLKKYMVSLIRSEVQKIRVTNKRAFIASFSGLSMYDFVTKWNDAYPHDRLLYPPTTWKSNSNPPAAHRYQAALPWPSGLAGDSDPPTFDRNSVYSYTILDDANFAYAVNKYGYHQELIPLKGKIVAAANRLSSLAVASYTHVTEASPIAEIEDVAHELSVHEKAVAKTEKALSAHSANKTADVPLKDKAATLFALKIGPLQQPIVTPFTAKKEYAKAFAALDATYQDLTHARSVLTILLTAMGMPSTYGHCHGVQDRLNHFSVLRSIYEDLKHNIDKTSAADRPSYTDIEENWQLSDSDWATKFPFFKRKLSEPETRHFLLDAFRGGDHNQAVMNWSTKNQKATIPQIIH